MDFYLLLVALTLISFLGLKLMDNINIEAICSYIKSIFSKPSNINIEAIRSYIKSIFSKLSNINIEAIRSYIKSKQKKIGAALILICLSIGYSLTLGNVISIKPSLENCNKACNVSVKNCIKDCNASVKNCIEDCNASLENCLEDCKTSIKINYKELYIYTVLSFYAFVFASLFFNELSKHKDL